MVTVLLNRLRRRRVEVRFPRLLHLETHAVVDLWGGASRRMSGASKESIGIGRRGRGEPYLVVSEGDAVHAGVCLRSGQSKGYKGEVEVESSLVLVNGVPASREMAYERGFR